MRSRRFGQRLRARRELLGLDQTETAAGIGIKQPHLSSVENGKSKLTMAALLQLARVFRLDQTELDELEQLRRRVEERGWWQSYGDILSDPVTALIELEADATWVRTHENNLIPAMLQTRAYAERVISAHAPHIHLNDLDRYVELRMRRQQRLADGLRYTVTVSEQAVRQQVGGPQVLAEQLEHLLRVVRDADVTMRVIPFSADAHAGMTDQFVIIQWPSEDDPEAVYVDGETSWVVHEQPRVVRQYTHAFNSASSRALPPAETIQLIQNIHEELTTQ